MSATKNPNECMVCYAPLNPHDEMCDYCCFGRRAVTPRQRELAERLIDHITTAVDVRLDLSGDLADELIASVVDVIDGWIEEGGERDEGE